jgi:hypothetical protein
MTTTIAPNHPKQKLLFFVAQDLDDKAREKVRDFVLQLASLRRWLNGPPHFVNGREEPQNPKSGDMAVETLGGYLEIYSAWPPWKLPIEIDRQHYDEVVALTNALCDFSANQELAFELELDGVFVGSITDGKMDRSLVEGLLGEWRQRFETNTS